MAANKAASAARRRRYHEHPVMRMEASYHRRIEETTGRSHAQWVAAARRTGLVVRKDLVAWLKGQGLGSNPSWWVASGVAEEAGRTTPAAKVEALYSGGKARLRPLHDALVDAALALGPDVKACPCGTKVPIFRKFCFAEIAPATTTRIDLGLALGPAARSRGRLEALGRRAAGNRITHRVRLASPGDVDAAVRSWLAEAYERGNEQQARPVRGTIGGRVPADLAKALARSSAARTTFEGSTPRMQAEWIEWIEGAVKAETRTRRIAQAVARLAAGRKRAY